MILQAGGLAGFLGKNSPSHLIKALKLLTHRAFKGFKIFLEDMKEVDIELLNKLKSNVALGYCIRNESENILFHGSFYKFEDGFLSKFSKSINQSDYEGAAKILSKLDGAYSFVLYKDDSLIYGRDPLGLKPLYIGRANGIIGLASEIKALQASGLTQIELVKPGYLFKESLNSHKAFIIKEIEFHSINESFENSIENTLKLICKSLKYRVNNKAVLGFSGGLDSSLLAFLASKLCNVELITISTKGSRDEIDALNAAKRLGIELHHLSITKDILMEILRFLSNLIECDKIMDLSIGAIIYLTAKRAKELGYDTLIIGQFADELFGGYMKYLKLFKERGKDVVDAAMSYDILNAHEKGFPRDEKASSPFVELILPYAQIDLVEYVASLPIDMKLNPINDTRKQLLRRVAITAGLPEDLALKQKKAMQYSSGIQKLINELMKDK